MGTYEYKVWFKIWVWSMKFLATMIAKAVNNFNNIERGFHKEIDKKAAEFAGGLFNE